MNAARSKLRLAVFVPGGVGPPGSRHRVPALAHLLEALSKTFSVSVFSMTPQPYPPEEPTPFQLFAPARATSRPGGAAAMVMARFVHMHRRRPFHLIHGFWALPSGLLAGWLGRWSGLPVLLTLMGGETARLTGLRYGNCTRRHHCRLTRWACRLARAVVVLSNHQAEQLSRLHWPVRKLACIPFGPLPDFYRPAPAKLTPPFRLLQAANLTPVKDQLSLLHAVDRLRRHVPVQLQIVGPDYWQGTVQRRCAALGLNPLVQFLGPLDHRRLPALYHRAQVYLQTSLHEAQGVSVAEAAAAGLFLAGTHTGLLADLAPEGALTVPPGDWQGLADRLLSVLKQPEKAIPLQWQALRWAQAHPFDSTVQGYLRLYRALQNEKLTSPGKTGRREAGR